MSTQEKPEPMSARILGLISTINLVKRNESQCAEIERLRADVNARDNHIRELLRAQSEPEQECSRLRAEIERLREQEQENENLLAELSAELDGTPCSEEPGLRAENAQFRERVAELEQDVEYLRRKVDKTDKKRWMRLPEENADGGGTWQQAYEQLVWDYCCWTFGFEAVPNGSAEKRREAGDRLDALRAALAEGEGE